MTIPTRFLVAVFLVLICFTLISVRSTGQPFMISTPQMLSDPFLQLPSETSVRVVWFTEFAGSDHRVAYGENLNQTAAATTTKLSRTREDQNSRMVIRPKRVKFKEPTMRDIWRHESEVTGLTPSTRVPYRDCEDGKL